jgi:1,4-dihydroxy-2-naphthoate octaprenyltransferase
MFLIFVAIFTGFTVTIFAVLAIFPAMRLLNQIQFRRGKELIEVLGATGKFQLILAALLSVGTLVMN